MRIVALLIALSIVGPGIWGCSSSKSGAGQASLNLAGSKQGQAVGFADVDGDGIEDKLVGAPYASTISGQTGALLVYKGNASGFSTIPGLVLTGGDNFGYSVVNLGDVDGDAKADFAIGAIHGDGADVLMSGSVSIFKGGSNGQIIKTVSGEGPMDKFGVSLAAGDLNADGIPDLVVGAPFNTNYPARYQSGAVYVFLSSNGAQAFTDPVKLYASSTNKSIGSVVAAGDVNGDSTADLLFSASGKVLVYFGASAFSPYLDAPDITFKSSASGFGKAISVVGDIDADGEQEIAIGAPNAVINTYRDTGSVYIIKGSASGTVTVDSAPAALMVRIDGGGFFNRFGASIAALGDIDADGKRDFAVGAPMADVTSGAGQNTLSGKVYVFKGKDVTSSATLGSGTAFNGKVKDQAYGGSLAATSGGILAIGAPRSNTDTGGVDMVDSATGQAVSGGSSGGTTGGSGDCH